MRRVAPSPARRARILRAAAARRGRCYLCRRIAEDLEANGALTTPEPDHDGHVRFPARAKTRHLRLEGIL